MATSKKQINANKKNALKSTGPKTEQGKEISKMNALKHGLSARTMVLPYLEKAEDWEEHWASVLADLRPEGYMEMVLAERIAILLWRMGCIIRYEQEVTSIQLENSERYLSTAEIYNIGKEDGRDYSALELVEEEIQQTKEELEFLDHLPHWNKNQKVDSNWVGWLLERVVDTAEDKICRENEDADLPDYAEDLGSQGDAWNAGKLRKRIEAIANDAGPDDLLDLITTEIHRELEGHQAELRRLKRVLDQSRRQSIIPHTLDIEKVHRFETSLERSLYKALQELQKLQKGRQDRNVSFAAVTIDIQEED